MLKVFLMQGIFIIVHILTLFLTKKREDIHYPKHNTTSAPQQERLCYQIVSHYF